MENKRYGGSAETREEALHGVLKEFEKDILKEYPVDRAFRISEISIEPTDVFDITDLYYNRRVFFKIEEIPLRLQEVVLLKQNDISELFYKKKYNFKEHIRILFKGELK